MRKFDSKEKLFNTDLPKNLKEFLVRKVKSFLKEYDCSDIGDAFSVIVLNENETDYISDKLLEFSETLEIGNLSYIHAVWVPSDGYSEDIYIPYSHESEKIFERRC